jgi:CysZ protein
MLIAFWAAVQQLLEGSFHRVLWQSVAIALALLSALVIAASVILAGIAPANLPGFEVLLATLGALAGLVLGWLLFPALTVGVIQLMAEPIADSVERRYYPDTPPPRRQPVREVLVAAFNLSALSLLVNLLALPVYLLLPALNLLIFLIFNGYIIARGYFETAAARRFAPAEQRLLWARHRARLWFFGAGLALLLTIPVVNLVLPILAMAAMVHIVERMRHRQTAK